MIGFVFLFYFVVAIFFSSLFIIIAILNIKNVFQVAVTSWFIVTSVGCWVPVSLWPRGDPPSVLFIEHINFKKLTQNILLMVKLVRSKV